ncbi:hypothetical protein CesoFtcFv8_024558 [Champsocephalus esox]|uniref:Uncharacterized protein n=1 Tax=Champsocephalus esox TaxID=159716 RepID=A0AAN8B657_9TELE|nr:hypothetical protein CesoFtcFv8_024558 [Champsocephalus esox]
MISIFTVLQMKEYCWDLHEGRRAPPGLTVMTAQHTPRASLRVILPLLASGHRQRVWLLLMTEIKPSIGHSRGK